ncbi:MAG: DUF4280 domain-containing protein [Eubacteriales bacterium]
MSDKEDLDSIHQYMTQKGITEGDVSVNISGDLVIKEGSQDEYNKIEDTYNEINAILTIENIDEQDKEKIEEENQKNTEELEAFYNNASEEDKEIIGAMLEYMSNHMKPDQYVVRGALLECDMGSHQRRIHLPLSRYNFMKINLNDNSSEVEFDEIMCANDFEAEVIGKSLHEVNIPFFGKCSGTPVQNIVEGYKKRAKVVFVDNTFKADPNYSSGVIRGNRCIPVIVGGWQNVHDKTKIVDSPALTTNSFLICNCGGIIRVVRSGQEDDKKQIKVDGLK